MAGSLQALAEAVDTDIEALANLVVPVPFCVVTRDTTQTTLPGSPENLGYETVNFDNDNMANLALDNAGITPPTPGLYFLHASTRCPDVSTQLEMFLRVGSTALDFGRTIHEGDAPAQPRLVVSGIASLSGTDRVRATIQGGTSPLSSIFGNRLVAYKIA